VGRAQRESELPEGSTENARQGSTRLTVQPTLVGRNVRRRDGEQRRRQFVLAGTPQHVSKDLRAFRAPSSLYVAQHPRGER
jgi:hypothetical protein